MTDPQVDDSGTPPRKRIAVAVSTSPPNAANRWAKLLPLTPTQALGPKAFKITDAFVSLVWPMPQTQDTMQRGSWPWNALL